MARASQRKTSAGVTGALNAHRAIATVRHDWPVSVKHSTDPELAAEETRRFEMLIELRSPDEWLKWEIHDLAKMAVLEAAAGIELDRIRSEGSVIVDGKGNPRPNPRISNLQVMQSILGALTRKHCLSTRIDPRTLAAGGKAARTAAAAISRAAGDPLIDGHQQQTTDDLLA